MRNVHMVGPHNNAVVAVFPADVEENHSLLFLEAASRQNNSDVRAKRSHPSQDDQQASSSVNVVSIFENELLTGWGWGTKTNLLSTTGLGLSFRAMLFFESEKRNRLNLLLL